MATEEANKPSALPSYPEMILEAIGALDDKSGSNKSAISKYMESKYGELTESHTALLASSLERMKESGELVMVKNNYMKPGPGVPPKRGRGRPPKAKPETPVAPTSPRPRGRPPKPKDPLAAAVAKAASGLPKRRGRPPKKAKTAAATTPAAAAGTPGVKRGRGRPPKVKPQPAPEVGFT